MSWWPLRSLKIVKVSEWVGGGGERGLLYHLCLFHRKWGGQGDDPSGAEDASDPEAGQHRRAEGGFSQEGEALPRIRICWEGQFNYTVISSRFSSLQHLGSKFQHAEAARLSIKKHHHGNIWTMLLVNNGIPHCVARVSSQVFIPWQVLFSYCTPVMLAPCPPLLPSESYIYTDQPQH